jgi:NAD-dependent dihydropyrimidine dehydrogenase PreA subunit
MSAQRLPVICVDDCTGCFACVDVCGPQCLEIEAGVAVLVRPDACTSDEHCVDACPTHAIHME